jgi:hypothetical protein
MVIFKVCTEGLFNMSVPKKYTLVPKGRKSGHEFTELVGAPENQMVA